MDGNTAIANVLKMEGIDFLACIPSNPLIEAAAIAGIRPIVFRQESTGVHMADGFARIQRQTNRHIPDAERARSGKRFWWRGPSLSRLGAHPIASRRCGPGPSGSGPHVQSRSELRIRHQMVFSDQ